MAGLQPPIMSPNFNSSRLGPERSAQQYQHPRRVPPRDTRLLVGNKRQKVSHSPPEKSSLSRDLLAQNKSQESGSDETASHWFDNVNQHVPQSAKATTGYDDEPPFFVSNQLDYRPNTFATSEGSKLYGGQSRLDSENEELRSVIDDLTIENKRLKQFLRVNTRSQRNSPGTDAQDKLFEVRMHGLSSEKRRELEFLLKNFATSVHTHSAPSKSNSTTGSNLSSNGPGNMVTGRPKTDSGYASNSTSGQASILHTHVARGIPGISQSARDNTIKNYLHDIPDTLLPRPQPLFLSERARMALVVRRLEQLFTGRKAAPGEHSQPLQQQEVSQMAARADAGSSKKRRVEGSREAHILPPDSKINLDNLEAGPEKRKRPYAGDADSDASAIEGTAPSTSRPGSPDQRPTRPLDLDIHRAQVAAENIQYLRHLGLSSPHLDSDESSSAWMYLNLLTNMAQLHTINVTPEFVRRSIKKISTKFEVSKDGRQVRWIGGPGGTVFSREEERALEVVDNNKDGTSPEEANDDLGAAGSGSKRSKTDSNSNAVISNTATSEDKTSGLQTSEGLKKQVSTAATSNLLTSLPTGQSTTASAFDYKPIVYRGRVKVPSPEESYLQDDSSVGDASRASSGLVHALSRSNLNQQHISDEGPITFYNNPYFCSDYSGDSTPPNMLPARPVVPGLTLGIDPGNNWAGSGSRLAEACYFTPQFGPPPFHAHHNEELPKLELVPLSTKHRDEVQPMEFCVTGLGGVVPDDNFAIDVNIHRSDARSAGETYPIRRVAYTGTLVKPQYSFMRGRCEKLDLIPSQLPPPSYMLVTSSSSSGGHIYDDGIDDDDDDDDDSDESSDESSSYVREGPALPAFLQHRSVDGSEGSDMDRADEHDDSSVDMLAVARAVDPVRIAEQERQYMINQPADRAVAGSLAATVGASPSATTAEHAGSIDSRDEDDDSNDDDSDDDDNSMDVDLE